MTPDESYPSRSDKSTQNPYLTAALDYHGRGWNVIPISAGTKKPALESWKKWQVQRQSEKEIAEWFSGGTCGVGIICGEISGGLTVLDFDNADLYEAWAAENPSLADTLPTVRTGRGYHVYFRSNLTKSIKRDGFDLKATGYVVAPPSVHPSGEHYKWINPLPPVGEPLPLLGGEYMPMDSGAPQTVVGGPGDSCGFPGDSCGFPGDSCGFSYGILWRADGEWRKRAVEKAIAETLPKSYGNRNRCIFDLAVRLRGLFETVEEAKPAVELWHAKALPNIKTKSFDATWLDFQVSWPKVEHPYYIVLDSAVAAADCRLKDGSCLKQDVYTDDCFRRLLEVCRVLAGQSADKTFFLSRRMAADIVKVDQWTAGNMLNDFCKKGFLEIAEEGTRTKARTYRWLKD